jgi:predicted dehydrogenase
MNLLEWLVTQSQENLVAIVDPDRNRQDAVKQWLGQRNQDCSKLRVFPDYRRMFDKVGRDLVAVIIAAPNHHHAPAALRALNLDMGVFCEKPLCHTDLHPHEWHGWFDFGNGTLGNMACHVLDGVFWALNVDHPASVEVEQMRDGSQERFPIGTRIRYDIPARGQMPPFKL